jgi:hypothetical protein
VKTLPTGQKSKKVDSNTLALNYSEKMISMGKMRKMSTIKRLMMTDDSEIPVEVAVGPETTTVPVPKRKQLKQNRWRWVAAGGDEVY